MRKVAGCFVPLLVIGLGLAAIALLVLFALGKPPKKAVSIEKIHAAQGLPVSVAHPVRTDFTDYLLCDGRVDADVRSMLRANIGEQVEAVHVKVGESVTSGQVVVEFRKVDVEAEIQAARAAFEEARAGHQRYQNLLEQKVASPERVEQARTAMESAAAALRAAESRVLFTEVRSPIDGVVETRWVEPGEYKGRGDELLSIVKLATVEVRALVPEEEVGALAVGQRAEFQLEGDPEWLAGQIRRISPATVDPNRFFDVFLVVENRRRNGAWLMRPGMYAEVRFGKAFVRDVLAVRDVMLALEGSDEVLFSVEEGVEQVPAENPTSREDEVRQNGFWTRVRRGWDVLTGKAADRPEEASVEMKDVTVTIARRHKVRTGLRQDGLVQLLDPPVTAQDRVIVNPREAVRDGSKVRVVQEGE
jgi:multidrug efflux system membrane fusion protein